jgi:hypothetical protein
LGRVGPLGSMPLALAWGGSEVAFAGAFFGGIRVPTI